jgi:hypothetical protein
MRPSPTGRKPGKHATEHGFGPNGAATIRPARGAVSRVTAGEALVLDLGSDRFYRFDAVGTRVWSRIGGGRTFQETVNGIVAELEVQPERALADLERLLEELAALGLVEVDDAAS